MHFSPIHNRILHQVKKECFLPPRRLLRHPKRHPPHIFLLYQRQPKLLKSLLSGEKPVRFGQNGLFSGEDSHEAESAVLLEFVELVVGEEGGLEVVEGGFGLGELVAV